MIVVGPIRHSSSLSSDETTCPPSTSSIWELTTLGLTDPKTRNQSQRVDEDGDHRGRVSEPTVGVDTGHDVGELRRGNSRGRTHYPASDIGGKTLPGRAQVGWVHSRQVVPPKADQCIHQESGDEDPIPEERQTMRGGEEVDEREYKGAGYEKNAQQAPLRRDPHNQHGKQQSAGKSTQLLNKLHAAHRLRDLTGRKTAHFGKAGDHARGLLNHAVSDGKATRHRECRDDGRLPEPPSEDFCDAGPLQ